jgi:cell division protein FtsB
MRLMAEIRSRARHVIGPVIGICAVGYFAYHLFHGDRGLIAWWQLSQRVENAREVLDAVQTERKALENRVTLLHPQSLDPDMLDERARIMLNYGKPGEIVIFTQKDQQPP